MSLFVTEEMLCRRDCELSVTAVYHPTHLLELSVKDALEDESAGNIACARFQLPIACPVRGSENQSVPIDSSVRTPFFCALMLTSWQVLAKRSRAMTRGQ